MEQLAKESEQGIRSQARTAHCATSLQRLKALKDYSSICLGATFVFALHFELPGYLGRKLSVKGG
jgi:hypothetical protein